MKFINLIFVCILPLIIVEYSNSFNTATTSLNKLQNTNSNSSTNTNLSTNSSASSSKNKNKYNLSMNSLMSFKSKSSNRIGANIKYNAQNLALKHKIKSKTNKNRNSRFGTYEPNLEQERKEKEQMSKLEEEKQVVKGNSSSSTKHINDFNNNKLFWEGWIKYFKFQTTVSPNHITNFYKNTEYYEQFKRNSKLDLNEVDPNENRINIPDETSFYGSLFKDSFAIQKLRSSKGGMNKVYDVMNLNFINVVSEEEGTYKGGIQDFGNQNNHGECFKVLSKVASTDYTWIFCLKNLKDKVSLMKQIKTLRIDKQRELGIREETSEDKNKSLRETIDSIMAKNTEKVESKMYTNSEGLNVQDGYWKILQDWSQCNLKCGGGISTLHRMCIPPIGNGKPCVGEPIIRRKCNTHACPTNEVNNDLFAFKNSTKLEETKPVQIKVLPFSERPQKYDKCIVKEADLIMIDNSEDKVELRIPVRVILNNSTITAFSGMKFEDMRKSFDLKQSEFTPSSNFKNCFQIYQNAINRAVFCDFGFNSSPEFYAEWNYDFNLFKHQCSGEKEQVNVSWMNDINDKLNKEKEKMKADLLMKKLNENKNNEDPLVSKKEENLALSALSREMDIEKLLEKEELQREKDVANELEQKLEMERKKQECLQKAIKEKEIVSQMNLKQQTQEEELSTLRKIAQKQIQLRREFLKKKLEKLRKRAELQNDLKKQQILNVRLEVANSLGKAYKKGSVAVCQKTVKTDINWKGYCSSNFSTDYNELTECNKETERCEYCCDKEFGDVHLEEKANCLKQVCKKSDENSNGRWVWKEDKI